MDQFQVILNAIFEKAGIEKSLKDVQVLAKQLPIEMTAKLNSASTRNDFKKLANEISGDLNKSLNLNLTGKDIMSAFDQMISGAKKASKEQEILANQIGKVREKSELLRRSEEKGQQTAQTNAINKSLEQEYMQREILASQMGKVREKSELLRQSEKKRQQLSQSNAINKSLEQEYTQREKLLAKIKESQTTGNIQTKFDTATSSYSNLEKIGVATDKLKTDFAQLEVLHDALGKSTTDDELIANYTKFDTILDTVNNSFKQIKLTELSSLKTAQEQVNFDAKRSVSVQKISTYLKDNSKLLAESKNATSNNYQEAQKWYNEIIRIQNALSNLDTSNLSNQNQHKVLTQQLSLATSKVKELGLEGRSATEEIKNMLQKFSGWFTVSQGIMFALGKFKEAIVELKQIDTTLTEISKTANVTAEQLAKIGDNSFETASQFGVKANDYLIGIQEMSRAGYENSEKMAALATMAKSAGDMSAELANDYLIASDAAYGYGGNIEKLTALLDGQNQITNRNAVSMEELANATKVAGTMLTNVANIPENELSALLGTGIATSRESGETVARAVKGIMMNLQQVKGESGFDGEIIDEESLKKVEARCHSVGVELEFMKDGIARLRDPMDILKELADVYNSLPKDSADRAGIIADIGGKYRGNTLASLLKHYNKVEKMMGDYENSSSSAMNEAMKSANNFEGSLNRLSNTWTDTIQNVVGSKELTTAVNGLNGLLDVVNKITSALGGLGTAGLIGGGILGAKSNSLDYRKYDTTQILQGSGKPYCYG